MAQYCRYCSHFVTGNGNYCEELEWEPPDEYAKHTNTCRHFDLNPIDAYGENPNEYKPRKPKRNDGQQIMMDL